MRSVFTTDMVNWYLQQQIPTWGGMEPLGGINRIRALMSGSADTNFQGHPK